MREQVRRFRLLALSSVLLIAAALVATGTAFSAPRHEGPASDHFDGRRFHNLEATKHLAGGLVKWMLNRDRGPWSPARGTDPGSPPPARVEGGRLRVTWVNHATVLVQMDGVNVLTDPIWSERCSPVTWAGPRRFRDPGIRFQDLPPIDVVVVSHNHYDHMDLPTLARLTSGKKPRLVVGLGNRAFLEDQGIPGSEEIDWWQSVEVAPGVTVTAVPAQHFSGRGAFDRDGSLWTGFVVKGPSGAAYFAGDTGMGSHFTTIRERLGPIRVALLPIGAFRPRWFMSPIHISPDEAIEAGRMLEAGTVIPIHFGTFPLGDDGQYEAPQEFAAARLHAGLAPEKAPVLDFGVGLDVP